MIYQITNEITKDIYIGFAKTSAKKRFTKHKLNAKSGGRTHLYNAMRKYGFENFSVLVLDENGTYEDEKKFIDILKPKYNMTSGGEGGDTSNSPNFKKSMKRYHSKKTKEDYATYGFSGKTHSDYTKEKQSSKRKKYWENLTKDRYEQHSEKISGSKNGMYGKTPKNSIQVLVNGVLYKSKAAAQRSLCKSWHYIMKNCEVKNCEFNNC